MPKISQLNLGSSPDGTEIFPVVQNGQTKRLNLDQIKSWLKNAPSDISLAGGEVYENSPVGTVVGYLSATSTVPNAIYSFSIVGGDTTLFSISGVELRIAQGFTFTAKPTTTVTIRVTENTTGNFYDEVFTFDTLQNLGDIPVNTVAPSITGVPEEGVPYLASAGTWTTDGNTTFEYQWLYGPDTEIAGANQLSYTPAEDDVGKTLRFRVRAIAVGRGPVELITGESAAIIAADDPEAEGPITALTAMDITPTSVRLVFPAQDPALRWQYRYKILAGGTPILGVYMTPTNYTLDGTVKQHTVNGLTPDTDEYYFQHRWETSTGVWSAWAPVTSTQVRVDTPAETTPSGPPTNTTIPALVFNPLSLVPGSTVQVTDGVWTANPAITGFTYAFYRRNNVGTETLIQNFSADNDYVVQTADINHNIVAIVKATNSSGSTDSIKIVSGLIQEATTPGTPSGNSEIEMFPPNLINPATVSLGTSDFWNPVSVTGDVLQDAIFTSAIGTQERNHVQTITGFANSWLEGFNWGPGGFLRYYHGRGEKWNHKVQFFALGGPQIDPFWIQTNVRENGLTHRLTRAGFYAQCAGGTWYANNAWHIITGNCNAAGTWTIDAQADSNWRWITTAGNIYPAVGDVWEIYSNTNAAANKRWVRIDSFSRSAASRDDRVTITGTDVTEPMPSNRVISNLRFAAAGLAIREFKRVGGVNTIRFVKAFGNGTPQGLQVNGVRKSNGDPWPEASDIWHINSFNSTTQTAVVAPRSTHSSITNADWTTTEVRAASYGSQHNTGSGTVTNHPDIVQCLNNTGMFPVEVFELNGRALYTYQYLRHNQYCKKYRMSNVDVERVDQWDMPYVFPLVRTSQGLDLQNYGSTYGMIREFNDVRWKADRGRNLVETQVAEPNMSWLVNGVSVHYPTGSAGAPGTTGFISVWDGTDPIFDKDEVFTTNFTFTGGGSDTAPTGVTWRTIVTTDIRGLSQNTPILEILNITAPRRGVRYTVTLTDTAGGRFQIYTTSRGASRAVAKGSAAITAGTYRITLRIQSSFQEGRTAGFTVDRSYDIVVNSSGVITAITVV
jgi:hypothetical protein